MTATNFGVYLELLNSCKIRSHDVKEEAIHRLVTLAKPSNTNSGKDVSIVKSCYGSSSHLLREISFNGNNDSKGDLT